MMPDMKKVEEALKTLRDVCANTDNCKDCLLRTGSNGRCFAHSDPCDWRIQSTEAPRLFVD